MSQKLPTDPYKGVRDFYPEDQFVQDYIFEHMARTCELFGYEEYNASILEPAELYRSKTSEEIVNEQTYTFTDRGEREVTLRPEMTPTFARMIAARSRDITMPARWYSIGNFFRYERPQKGRIREFWQLNADIVGAAGIEADAEVITLAHAVMRSFGADERNFEIRVSDRRLLDAAYDDAGINTDVRHALTRLLDRRAKIHDFPAQIESLVGNERANWLLEHLDRTTSTGYLEKLSAQLRSLGIGNMLVDTSVTRGFDYYTGMVFEVFDTSGENPRALFGGGRYDNLMTLFGHESIPAVGFGMGDVTLRDFLETHNLTPDYIPTTELMLCVVDESAMGHAQKLAQDLRREDVAVAVNFSGKRIGDQIRQADKMKIPYMIAVGEKERDSGQYTLKNLSTGHELTTTADKIAEHLFSSLG
ncbi:MAG: histidine--tRNA ligase [Patescibacteria group bacterium]